MKSPTHPFLSDIYSRQTVQDDFSNFGVKNMTDEEIEQSIVNDVYYAYFFSVSDNVVIEMTKEELFRFISDETKDRVSQALDNAINKHFIVIENNILVPNKNKEIMQTAMDFCGSWFEGFEPSDKNEKVIMIYNDEFCKSVNEYGSIENLATSLSMELSSNFPAQKTLQ